MRAASVMAIQLLSLHINKNLSELLLLFFVLSISYYSLIVGYVHICWLLPKALVIWETEKVALNKTYRAKQL
jgi:hypothetical protein